MTAAQHSGPSSDQSVKVALASLIGTAIEWYDFFIYASAATLVFNALFFPSFEPLTGTLVSLGVFGVAFIARPIGGVLFGHWGDRLGRKKSLVLTLSIMGVATGAIGLLPTYASIGVLAPILLSALRFAQGLAVGGEWGGAVLMAVEHAPRGRRSFFGSWPQMGSPLGLIAASAMMGGVALLPRADLLAWGWRIPFLTGFALLAVGLVIRLKVAESPDFDRAAQTEGTHRVPVAELLGRHKWPAVLGVGSQAAVGIGFYVLSVFVLGYATRTGLSSSTISLLVMGAAAVDLAAIPVFAALADRFGLLRVFVVGSAFLGLWAFPFFALIDTGAPAAVFVALVVAFVLGHAPAYAAQSTLLAELFEVRIRYTGTAVSYAVGNMLWGAPIPLVATAAVAAADSAWPVAVMMLGGTVITMVTAMLMARRTRHRSRADSARVGALEVG